MYFYKYSFFSALFAATLVAPLAMHAAPTDDEIIIGLTNEGPSDDFSTWNSLDPSQLQALLYYAVHPHAPEFRRFSEKEQMRLAYQVYSHANQLGPQVVADFTHEQLFASGLSLRDVRAIENGILSIQLGRKPSSEELRALQTMISSLKKGPARAVILSPLFRFLPPYVQNNRSEFTPSSMKNIQDATLSSIGLSNAEVTALKKLSDKIQADGSLGTTITPSSTEIQALTRLIRVDIHMEGVFPPETLVGFGNIVIAHPQSFPSSPRTQAFVQQLHSAPSAQRMLSQRAGAATQPTRPTPNSRTANPYLAPAAQGTFERAQHQNPPALSPTPPQPSAATRK